MVAARLGVPVVPVRLEGLDRVLHHTWKFPARGPSHRDVWFSHAAWRGMITRRWLIGWRRPCGTQAA